jgi:hypothetical protein
MWREVAEVGGIAVAAGRKEGVEKEGLVGQRISGREGGREGGKEGEDSRRDACVFVRACACE